MLSWTENKMHDISFIMPKDWLIRTNREFFYKHGSLDLVEPSEHREAVVTIFWRPYELLLRKHCKMAREKYNNSNAKVVSRIQNYINHQSGIDPSVISKNSLSLIEDKYSNDEVYFALTSYKNSVDKSLKSNYKNYKVEISEETTFNKHLAFREEIYFTARNKLFTKVEQMNRIQYFFVCKDTARFFAVYSSSKAKDEKLYYQVLSQIMSSVNCHCITKECPNEELVCPV